MVKTDHVQELLEMFDVNWVLWDEQGGKEVKDLAGEINEGESILQINNEGLVRVCSLVSMHIIDPLNLTRGHLLEWDQLAPGGRYRQQRKKPSESIKKGESPEQALIRGMEEELTQAQGDYTFSFIGKALEPRASKSYPGLTCRYDVHHFRVELQPHSTALRDTFEIEDKGGEGLLTFRWEIIH